MTPNNKRNRSSEFDPYCAFKDDGERRRALLYLNVRLAAISAIRWLAFPVVMAMTGDRALHDHTEKVGPKIATAAGEVTEQRISLPVVIPRK